MEVTPIPAAIIQASPSNQTPARRNPFLISISLLRYRATFLPLGRTTNRFTWRESHVDRRSFQKRQTEAEPAADFADHGPRPLWTAPAHVVPYLSFQRDSKT